jgi:hypothetical protein
MSDGETREEVPMDVIDHQQAERKEEVPLPGHFSRSKPVKWIAFVVIS